jgi:ATP-dependent helicase STH1/SNF2
LLPSVPHPTCALTPRLKLYGQAKAQGVPDSDPEQLKRGKILAFARQRQEMHKRQLQMRQQQQQQIQQQQRQQQPQLNQPQPGQLPQDALNGSLNGPSSAIQPINGVAQQSTPQPPSAALSKDALLSADQQSTLRQQLAAFNYLQKNMPIPQNIQESLFQSQKSSAVDPSKPATPAAQSSSKAHRFQSFKDPHSLVPSAISYLDHTRRDQRSLIPSIMPLGIDVDRVREEREAILYNRIVARKNELDKLPANIGSWDTTSSTTPVDNGKLKLKALIEHKMLSLLPKQRAMRALVSREMMQSDNLAMTANRALYRRIKKQSLREARITEKLEKQQQDAHESKEKKKHNDFLRSVLSHGQDVKNSAANQRARIQKLGRLMQTTHANIEKEEQKRIERTAKQRLQALKANDEETYLKLLGQAKDSRISHLLKQTDGFLDQLAASVKEQQRGAARRYGIVEEEEEEEEEEEAVAEDAEDGEGKSKKVDYYEVAHKIKEEVTAQANILVGGKLKDYQIKGLQWMISLYNNNLNGILADEMGLGKTIQTISLITYLIEKKRQPGPFLVIVPLSTLTNWNNEFDKWAPSVTKIVYKGAPAQRKTYQNQIRYGNFQVLLTTYEFIIKDRPVLSKIKWLHMIVDEGHRMKNANSKLSSTITQYYNTRYRLILTGTPLQNNLPELWALLNFVLPTIFKSVKSFDEWFNTPFANTGGQDKMELSEEEQLLVIRRLHKVLRPFLLRRLKKDVEKDLPDKQERVIKCNFSALQAKLYKQLLNHNRLMVSDGKGGKTGLRGLSNMLMQLRKLCNHPYVFEEVEDQINPGRGTNDSLWRTAGKFELLDRILPKLLASGHRVLMFFQMTQIMNIMEDFMRLRGLKYLRLDGSTKADDRSELLRVFNAPDSPYFCFLLSTRAGGLGLNLQTADTVIIYDSDWNPHQDLQAQDRAHRIGQKNEVRILRLISSNSVEEKILERANYKLDMDGKVIQAGKFDNRSTNEERDEMLRVMLESAEAAEALEQDEMDDDDLNLVMMRSDAELALFEQMDRDRKRDQQYGPGKQYPRLMCEAELPDIYANEDLAVEEVIEAPTGRGNRERAKVKYDDGLTEEQWLEAVDNSEDDIESAVARKQARISRRAGNKEKRDQDDVLDETPPPEPESRVSSESPQPKKRGRKPKAETVQKRKAEEEVEAPQPRKRGRQAKVPDLLSPSEREHLQSVLDSVHDTLMDLEEVSADPDLQNRGIIDPFIELPPPKQYPDYYQLIRIPVCMDQIQKKINKKQYQNLRQFRQDIKQLCDNCRTYNEDGSVLFQDANLIEVFIDTC